MKTTFRFEGGKELQRNLQQLSGRLSRQIVREELTQAGEPMRAEAARNAPYEPGAPDLRANIVISPVRAKEGVEETAVAIGPSRPFYYGFFQEFGTKFHGAQPFMRPAFDTKVGEVLKRLSGGLWRNLASRGFSQSVNAPTTVQSDGRTL